MTVYLVLSLPRIPYIHCIYMVLANPICKWFPHTSSSSHPHNPYTKEREPLHMHASTSFHARRMLQRPFMHDACFNDLSCTTHASTSFHARRMLQRPFMHDVCFNDLSCTTHASTSFHARRMLQRHFIHDACFNVTSCTTHLWLGCGNIHIQSMLCMIHFLPFPQPQH